MVNSEPAAILFPVHFPTFISEISNCDEPEFGFKSGSSVFLATLNIA